MLAVEPLASGRWDEEKRQDQGARDEATLGDGGRAEAKRVVEERLS